MTPGMTQLFKFAVVGSVAADHPSGHTQPAGGTADTGASGRQRVGLWLCFYRQLLRTKPLDV